MNSPLLAPYRSSTLHLPHRVAMAPMTRSRAEENGAPTPLMARYYAQRATAGLIVSEGIWPHHLGKGGPGVPGLTEPAHVAGWNQVTRAVHAAGGRIFAQLWHVGRVSHPDILDGEQPVAPSAVPITHGRIHTADGTREYTVPRALSRAEIADTVESHAAAARHAMAAGFDGVEINGAYGYLIGQFLSDGANLRTDGYADRTRFAIEVVEAVADAIGAHRTALRLSPDNPMHDLTESDPAPRYHRLLQALDGKGLAYLHLVRTRTGTYGALEDLRPRWSGTLMATLDGPEPGTPQQAEDMLRAGLADVYAFGRHFLANPDLPRRIATGSPLNAPRAHGRYGGGAEGYVDYPFLPSSRSAALAGGAVPGLDGAGLAGGAVPDLDGAGLAGGAVPVLSGAVSGGS